MSSGHIYTCSFEKSNKDLFKFMKLFKITANLKLHVVIHELTCETKNCEYQDNLTLSINGNYFHITNKNDTNAIVMTLLLPYEYDFRDVDSKIQYEILKYNELDFDTTEYSVSIDIVNDAEVVCFKVNYEDEYISFKDLLLKNDIHVDYGPDFDKGKNIEQISDNTHRLKFKLVEV